MSRGLTAANEPLRLRCLAPVCALRMPLAKTNDPTPTSMSPASQVTERQPEPSGVCG